MQKENFSESAPRCNGVHLQGEELVRLGMHYISNERVVTGLPRTGFFGSTASLTKEKTRRVGGAITESLCALILVENTPLICVERERSRMRAHTSYSPCVPRDIHCIYAEQKAKCRTALAASVEKS